MMIQLGNISKPSDKIECPRLMYCRHDSQFIMLFVEHDKGICLSKGNSAISVGEFSDGWTSTEWILCPPTFTVTLANE